MSMRVRISHALLALALILVPVQLTRADGAPPLPPGAAAAHQCAERIQIVTQQTAGAIVNAAHNGVQRIGALDADDAPDAALLNAAGNARDRVNSRAEGGRLRVTHLADHCLEVLEALGAPPAVRAVVINAREHALDVIGNARQTGIGAINQALQQALAGKDA